MSYRVRRINPYWNKNPILPIVAAAGVVLGLLLASKEIFIPALVCGGVAGVAIFLATQPAVSAVLATLGFLGGVMTFIIFPKADILSMSGGMRLLSTVLFTLFYTVLMD